MLYRQRKCRLRNETGAMEYRSQITGTVQDLAPIPVVHLVLSVDGPTVCHQW